MEDGSSSLSQWIKLTLTVTSSSMIFLVVHVIRVDDRRALLVRPLAPCARGSWAGGLVGSSRVVCARAPATCVLQAGACDQEKLPDRRVVGAFFVDLLDCMQLSEFVSEHKLH